MYEVVQLCVMQRAALTFHQLEQYDALLSEGEEWTQKAALKQGSWKTESIVPWFGEAAGITLSYDLLYLRWKKKGVSLKPSEMAK